MPPSGDAHPCNRLRNERKCDAKELNAQQTKEMAFRQTGKNTGKSPRIAAERGPVLRRALRRLAVPSLWPPSPVLVAATLDGRVEATGAVFEAKFMLPWSFCEEAAAEKYMP